MVRPLSWSVVLHAGLVRHFIAAIVHLDATGVGHDSAADGSCVLNPSRHFGIAEVYLGHSFDLSSIRVRSNEDEDPPSIGAKCGHPDFGTFYRPTLYFAYGQNSSVCSRVFQGVDRCVESPSHEVRGRVAVNFQLLAVRSAFYPEERGFLEENHDSASASRVDLEHLRTGQSVHHLVLDHFLWRRFCQCNRIYGLAICASQGTHQNQRDQGNQLHEFAHD